MAAQTDTPGAFALEVAELGKSLMSAYTRFIIYRKVGDRRLENLYATLSITSTMFMDLGTTLNKYQNNFNVKDVVTRSICQQGKANFERFLVMINEGNSNKGIWMNDGTIGGQSFTVETDPWLLITMGLGGEEAAKAFWKSLDDTRDLIIELNDIVKYTILKYLKENSLLDLSDTLEFEALKRSLPHLVQSYQKGAELRKAETERDVLDAGRDGYRRRPSNASSDTTIFVDRQPTSRPESVILKDFEVRSISSRDSVDSLVQTPPIQTKNEVYEEWLLRWNPPIRNVQRSWGLFGLKIKSYYEDSGFWDTNSELRTEAEMKEQHDISRANLSASKHKEAMQKAIQAIPKEGGSHIDRLLEERSEACSINAKREWSVVAVRSKQKYPYSSNKAWGKDPRYTDWLITIKGKTVDTLQRGRTLRWEDPFERQDERYRSPIRIRSRSPVRRNPQRRMPRYPIPVRPRSPYRPRPTSQRPFFLRPPSVRRAPIILDTKDDFKAGSLVVGKIMNVEEAEKKMKEIWAEITGENIPVTKSDSTTSFSESQE